MGSATRSTAAIDREAEVRQLAARPVPAHPLLSTLYRVPLGILVFVAMAVHLLRR